MVSFTSTIAGLLSLAPVLASLGDDVPDGKLHIHNHCTFPVRLSVVCDPNNYPDHKIPAGKFVQDKTVAPGSCFTDSFHYMPIGGIAVKLYRDTPCPSAPKYGEFQFEYHVEGPASAHPGWSYADLSHVDCNGNQNNHGPCPFQAEGIRVDSGDWRSRECRPGEARCEDAYNYAKDDTKTFACDMRDDHDTHLHLCTINMSQSGAKGAGAAGGGRGS